MKATVGDATRACHEAGEAGDDMIQTLDRMTQRATVFLRHSASGNRRRHKRVPIRLDAFITVGDVTHDACALDISRGGVLLDCAEDILKKDVVGKLRLPSIGSMPVRIMSRSELGWHTAFLSVDPEAMRRIDAAMIEAEARCEPIIAWVESIARQISGIFTAGVVGGEVTIDELITTEYRPIEQTNPVQYRTMALEFYEKVLPPVLEARRAECQSRPHFVVAIDRNAYLPVHHQELSLPQRRGQTAWNDLHSRNRRLLDRWQTLIGARNTERSHLRVYSRHKPDGAIEPIIMISCPVFVRAQHWGNVQVGLDF